MTCTCRISKTPCNMAFVYDGTGKIIAEIPMENVRYLKPELTALCVGAGLQKLNKEIVR